MNPAARTALADILAAGQRLLEAWDDAPAAPAQDGGLTYGEAAKRLACHRSTIGPMVADGLLDGYSVSKSPRGKRVTAASVEARLNSHRPAERPRLVSRR